MNLKEDALKSVLLQIETKKLILEANIAYFKAKAEKIEDEKERNQVLSEADMLGDKLKQEVELEEIIKNMK